MYWKKIGLENTAAYRTHVATPAATAPATTDTSTMVAPATEAAKVATTSTTSLVASPTAIKQCISGSTNTAAATIVTSAEEHIHETAAKKWIPATAVGTTKMAHDREGRQKTIGVI